MACFLRLTGLSLVLWGLAPDAVEACTYSPVQAQLLVDTVPLAGPVLIDVDCTLDDYCDDGEPELRVRDAAGAEVAGALTRHRGLGTIYLVWLPDAELTAGETYTLSFGGDAPGDLSADEHEVTADAAATLPTEDIDALSIQLGSHERPEGEELCCVGGFACFDVCFTEQVRVAASLSLAERDDAGRMEAAHAYRITLPDSIDSGFRRVDQWVGVFSDEPAERFCATLEVLSLVDGSVASRELCLDTDPNVAIGEVRDASYEPDDFISGDCPVPPGALRDCDPRAEDCNAPPALILEPWCDGNAQVCAEDPDVLDGEPCEAVAAFCETDGPDAPSADAGPADDGGDDSDGDDGACAVGSRGDRGHGVELAVPLALVALAARHRRLRRRR